MGTNIRVEVIALWGLLFFARHINLGQINIYGDAKIVIDWINERANLNAPMLTGWMERILNLKYSFDLISFSHVYREHNFLAESLSKKGLSATLGRSHFQFFQNGHRREEGSIPLG